MYVEEFWSWKKIPQQNDQGETDGTIEVNRKNKIHRAWFIPEKGKYAGINNAIPFDKQVMKLIGKRKKGLNYGDKKQVFDVILPEPFRISGMNNNNVQDDGGGKWGYCEDENAGNF